MTPATETASLVCRTHRIRLVSDTNLCIDLLSLIDRVKLAHATGVRPVGGCTPVCEVLKAAFGQRSILTNMLGADVGAVLVGHGDSNMQLSLRVGSSRVPCQATTASGPMVSFLAQIAEALKWVRVRWREATYNRLGVPLTKAIAIMSLRELPSRYLWMALSTDGVLFSLSV